MRPVLIVGVPRSGSTWVQRLLGKTPQARAVYEPDNESVHPAARVAKRSLSRFPVLGAGADAPRAYERIWARAMAGVRETDDVVGRLAEAMYEDAPQRQLQLVDPPGLRVRAATALTRLPRIARSSPDVRPLVKTVHAAFAVDWIVDRWDPQVVVLLRDPLNVLASMLELDMADRDRRLDDDPLVWSRILEPLGVRPPSGRATPLARAAWQLGVLGTWLAARAARHPSWVVVRHEDLCAAPVDRFRGLVAAAGLTWTPACERYLARSNGPGEGYELRRVAAEQPDRWRSRLGPEQIREARAVLDGFPPVGHPARTRSGGAG